ncbi:terminase small subunit [Neobacillus rhizophilus]|uniref:Terminase small subunit n=1 Tax=Neobacillus rhizophilus TaxID=2833579 RepID=A0A942U9Z6_9BACI|nr:terminase small subunit [Neobacillus rhizophilus]MBS4214938.1 terminase small subunit [Neobacillus rhizophilus]
MEKKLKKHDTRNGRSKPDYLSETQEAFCYAYIAHGQNLQKAIEEVGIKSRTTGYKYLDNPLVQEKIQQIQELHIKPMVIQTTKKLELLTNIAKGEDFNYYPDFKTGKIIKTPVNASDKIKAMELMSKIDGDFVVRHQVQQENTVFVIGGEALEEGRQRKIIDMDISYLTTKREDK